jgi:hypothetical protein
MLLERHLQVQPSEFAHVARSVRVLSTKDGADFEHTVHITAEHHLLVQLRGLCQTRRLIEVLEGEDLRTAFTSASDDFWRVDLNEVMPEKTSRADAIHKSDTLVHLAEI